MNHNWTYKKLGEVCDKITDGSHNPPKGVAYSNYLMISSQNVFNDRIETNDVRYLSESDFLKEDKRTLVRKNDVLLTIVGTIGRCAVVENDYAITLQRSVAVLTPKPFIGSRYLMYCCIGNNETLNSNAHGIAQKGIYLKQLSKIQIPLPPLETQSRIVAELDLLQAIIDKQKAQLAELDNLAQCIFYDMFGDPVDNDKGWEVKKLGEMSITITKGTTPTTVGFSFVSEGINFVKVESFDNGKIDASKLTHITKDCNDALLRSQLEDLDLLICIAGATIGKMAIVDSSILPANTNQACAIIRLKNKGSLVYIQSFLAHKFKLDVEQMGKGVAQPNLSLGQLRELQIPLPPLSLQQSFAAKIESIEKQKAAINQSIAETQKLFNFTMDKYFG